MTIQELKEKQLEIILTFNPMTDDYHTGIRAVSDIHTFQELYDEEILAQHMMSSTSWSMMNQRVFMYQTSRRF